ncbi:MAG TPA: glycosyltransferase family 39 protein [Bryobacteraceae bacterium]|nr:glycosyltransferase family 39 protein [Bryobacteraceae bacterium]
MCRATVGGAMRQKFPAWIYYVLLFVILFVGAALRCSTPNIHRQIIPGDETIYHYAALDIIKHRTLTREIAGDMYRGSQAIEPSSRMSPGYPLFLATIYKLGGKTSTVIALQIALSIAALAMILAIMRMLRLRKVAVVAAMAAASLYPGFLYNIDRLLTENLFVAIFTAYCILFIRFIQRKRVIDLILSGILLVLAIHVRANAAPFVLLSLAFLLLYRDDTKNGLKHAVIFIAPILILMLPWWVRNILDFDRFILLSEGGEGAKVWGSVPYFIDMSSTNGHSLQQVIDANKSADPAIYEKWRFFGLLQYMWGDLWDEWLVHPNRLLRPFLWLHWFVVVPSVMAIPLFIRRASPSLLFVCAIPLAFTLMNMPFHGLPRYVYPSIPFVFVIFGVLVDRVMSIAGPRSDVMTSKEDVVQVFVRIFAILAASALSMAIGYSVYVFSFREHKEMSMYRLARYMGVHAPPRNLRRVASQSFQAGDFTIENSIATKCALGTCYKNNGTDPSIVHLIVKKANASEPVITAVTINSNGGYLYDYATVYWTGKKTDVFSENFVYRFPVSKWTHTSTIYIDDDATSLMIVPYVFRWDSFTLSEIEVVKYAASATSQDSPHGLGESVIN